MNGDFFYDFWIGKDSNLSDYWAAYHEGDGYKRKFSSMKCHIIEITFEKPSKEHLFLIWNLYTRH